MDKAITQIQQNLSDLFTGAGKKVLVGFLFLFALAPFVALASEINGVIDSTYKYAYGENVGWINFGCDNCAVSVTDTGLSGYALGENIGWIYLGDVENDGEGNLSGYAWAENVGYIKFDPTNGGVKINSSGEFTGSALGENIGWVIFDGDYVVKTDWRPASSRTSEESTSAQEQLGGRRRVENVSETASPVFALNVIADYSQNVSSALKSFLAFLSGQNENNENENIVLAEIAAEKSVESLSGGWELVSSQTMDRFLFAALPPEIQNLVKKFPELQKTFKEVGITKVSDLQKLENAKFILPGLNSKIGFNGGVSVPISKMTDSQKKLIPSEIVFAKAGDLIDYNIQLSINEKGIAEQKITTIAGKSLDLAIKEDKPVDGIKGYVVIKNIERQQARKNIPADSMLASPLLAVLGTKYSNDEQVKIEEKLVVGRFDYEDENGDNIYTAKIQSPLVYGEYEIISIIDYKDSKLGKKELRLTTVVDPEGYVFEKNGNKETRIPDAKISLFVKNEKTGVFDLWSAKEYQQINPQKTDKSGSYSFLVPEGNYKISVIADGYYPFESDEFKVEEGRGVHQNIELKPKSWWRSLLNLFR